MTTPPRCIRHSLGATCFIASMGTCHHPECSNRTASGAFEYCNKCAIAFNRCQLCGAAVTFEKTEVLAVIDEEIKRLHTYSRRSIGKLMRIRSLVDQGEIVALDEFRRVYAQEDPPDIVDEPVKPMRPSFFKRILSYFTN